MRSGGFVWYPYSVSQSGFGPSVRVTSDRMSARRAIVNVEHSAHGEYVGVSNLDDGYGFAAYASSFACAACMPRMKSTGDMPLGVLRGDVTPPATTFARFALCSQT